MQIGQCRQRLCARADRQAMHCLEETERGEQGRMIFRGIETGNMCDEWRIVRDQERPPYLIAVRALAAKPDEVDSIGDDRGPARSAAARDMTGKSHRAVRD